MYQNTMQWLYNTLLSRTTASSHCDSPLYGGRESQEMYGFMRTILKKSGHYKWLTSLLCMCSDIACFVEGLLQQSADLVGSGALLHFLLVFTKEQFSIHALWGQGRGGVR